MALLSKVDDLISGIDKGFVNEKKANAFNFLDLEDNVLYHIFSYLIDEAPLEDALVLPCKRFRFTTYNHPIMFPKHYHVRIDPKFRFSKKYKDDKRIQFGANISPATKQAVIINNINGITNNPIFPFKNMRVFQFTKHCTLSIVCPIFKALGDSFKYLGFAACKFLGEDASKSDEEDPIPIFKNCSLFTLIFDWTTRWDKSLNLNKKFPNLSILKLSVENVKTVHQVQSFLDSTENTVSMLFIEFGFRAKDFEQNGTDDAPLFNLKIPKNIEVLSIYCAEDMNFGIDLSACHNNLKYLVALKSSIKFIHNAFEKNGMMKSLKYLVINSLEDVYEIKWDLFKKNGIKQMYLPSLPSFSKSIQGSGDIELFGHFPDINEVKQALSDNRLRVLLRELNNQQKRHFLWGYFWFESREKLKLEERELARQDSE